MAIEILPALLVRSVGELEDGLHALKGVAPWVQVDLVGRNYMEGEENFPMWEEFNFEVDLMVQNQEREAQAAVALGASRVVVHAEGDWLRALEVLQKYRQGEYAVGVGVALHAGQTIDVLSEVEGLYDYVQVMGIAHEGAQGEPADSRALELVRALCQAYPELVVQVDGAVAGRIKELVAAGATRLVIGSAIVGADNPKAAYKELYTEATDGSHRQTS